MSDVPTKPANDPSGDNPPVYTLLGPEFLAKMAERLRAPMNAALSAVQNLSDTELKPEQEVYARTIWSSARALLSMVDDLLDLWTMDAGHTDTCSIDFDIGRLLEEVAISVADAAQRKGIDVAVSIGPEVPTMACGDPGRIREILFRLAQNAVHATERGEIVFSVGLSGEREGPLLKFDVADTGRGIENADQERVFSPFERAGVRKAGFDHPGLGLPLAAAVASALGGRITARSAPTRGSTFSVLLPMVAASRSGDSRPVPNLAGKRVLLAGTKRGTRSALQQTLASWGLHTVVAENDAEAEAALAAAVETGEALDVILADLDLPPAGGASLIERVGERFSSSVRPECAVLVPLAHDPRTTPKLPTLSKPIRRSDLSTFLAAPRKWRQRVARPLARGTPPVYDKLRILLVANDDSSRAGVLEILGKLGVTPDTATNGLEAVRAAQMENYDLILMDCNMPLLSGYDATRRIRHSEHGRKRATIVALTGSGNAAVRDMALAAGMDDHTQSPLSRTALSDLLQRWTVEEPDG